MIGQQTVIVIAITLGLVHPGSAAGADLSPGKQAGERRILEIKRITDGVSKRIYDIKNWTITERKAGAANPKCYAFL